MFSVSDFVEPDPADFAFADANANDNELEHSNESESEASSGEPDERFNSTNLPEKVSAWLATQFPDARSDDVSVEFVRVGCLRKDVRVIRGRRRSDYVECDTAEGEIDTDVYATALFDAAADAVLPCAALGRALARFDVRRADAIALWRALRPRPDAGAPARATFAAGVLCAAWRVCDSADGPEWAVARARLPASADARYAAAERRVMERELASRTLDEVAPSLDV